MSKPIYWYCVARGRDHEWEAFCLDFDLAVQGRSYDEVSARLKMAIHHYVETATAEPEPTRTQLLTRRVPLGTRVLWRWRVIWWNLFGRKVAEESTFGFPVPCPV